MAIIYGHHCNLALFRKIYREIASELTRSTGQMRQHGSMKPCLTPEPFRSCLAAEYHRQFWRPTEPRVVLLAESHVYTDIVDLRSSVARKILPLDIQHSPKQFVRLIYCLAYGENTLVQGTLKQPNEGTRQYWRLFGQ